MHAITLMLCKISESDNCSYVDTLQRDTHGKRCRSARYKCAVCAAEFTSLTCRDRHLRTHVTVSHSAHDVVVCQLCSEECERRSYMSTHLLSHKLIYFCSVCSASFPSSLRLVSHVVQHQTQPLSLSSADLFWQSIAVSVFLPQSNDCSISWLDGSTDPVSEGKAMNGDPGNSLEDVLQEAGSDMLANMDSGHQECSREVAKCGKLTYDQHIDVDTSASSSVTDAFIDQNVCFRMGFKPMSRDMFIQLRQAFGCNECEYCGELFSAQSDLDTHMNGHTGLFLLIFPIYCFLH